MPTRITKQQFHRVNRFIKDQREKRVYNADHIAKHFGISPESVRKIARAKTWPAFDAFNASRRKVKPIFQSGASGTGVVKAVPLPNSLTITSAPEKQYTIEITRAEYRKLLALEQRVEDLEAWRKNQFEAEKGLIALQVADLEQPRRRFWRKH